MGLIGCEGVTALAVILGAERAPHATFMQVAGSGLSIRVEALREALQQSLSLHRTLTRYAHTFFVQTTYTALSNGRSTVEERLARWLLMAQDRLQGDEVPLTHEFLSVMLGTRRAGVTTALLVLKAAKLIDYRRGLIRVIDRDGLEKASNGAYGGPEAEYQRLFGSDR